MLKFLLIAALPLCAENASPDVSKISEAMGHLIGKNLESLGLQIDLGAVVKGIKDESEGKTSPLNEDECIQAIALLQEETTAMVSEKNLAEADAFLIKNRNEKGVVALEEGKLQYRIEKEGEGQTVQTYNSPIVQYKASYLNGLVFGTSEGDELLSLDETIPGFGKGVVGMKEGETRTLYIHPDLGYGKQGFANSLLIFEVTVKKADATAEAHSASQLESLPKNLLKDPPEESPAEAR